MTDWPTTGCIIKNKKKAGFKFFMLCFQFLVIFDWEAGFKLEKQPSLREVAQMMLGVCL